MAIDRSAWRRTIDYPPVRFVRFAGSALAEGVEVPITNPARSIVDCFRYRAKIGLDVALEGHRQSKITSDELWAYAKKARIWSTIRPYVEATVADGT